MIVMMMTWILIRRTRRKNSGRKDIPVKVCWFLPVTPRLEHLFANPDTAKLMRWHEEERIRDGSPQWRNIDRLRPLEGGDCFGDDPRNVRFALSTDGMNPLGNMSTNHSTWPVNLSIYNLPPWLCMKRRHIMLAIVIQGPKQPGDDIDVYLAPLVEELRRLWIKGVKIYDAHAKMSFTLRCMLFITINDYPAYGNLSGQAIKWFNACVQCVDKTASSWLFLCKKMVFMRHRRFLPLKHKYRSFKKKFDNTVEEDLAPPVLIGRQIYDRIKNLKYVYEKKQFKRMGIGKGKGKGKGPAIPAPKPV